MPGFFWFAGQGGYGIQSAAGAAQLAAALWLGRRMPETLRGRACSRTPWSRRATVPKSEEPMPRWLGQTP